MSSINVCYHCGNKTPMETVAEYNTHEEFEDMWEEVNYYLLLCPVCKNVTLEQTKLFSEDVVHVLHATVDAETRFNEINNATKRTVLFPADNIETKYIPKEVLRAFESAIRVRNIDLTICVMALRRALEKMCKEKLAEGKTLAAKLQNLQQNKVLPDRVGEIAQLLKDHGNTAAHADDIEFDEKRVDLLIHFTQVILNYVYTIPEQLNEIKGQMKD